MWEEKRKFYEAVVEKCDGVEAKGWEEEVMGGGVTSLTLSAQ
jgi:hypothetical protein